MCSSCALVGPHGLCAGRGRFAGGRWVPFAVPGRELGSRAWVATQAASEVGGGYSRGGGWRHPVSELSRAREGTFAGTAGKVQSVYARAGRPSVDPPPVALSLSHSSSWRPPRSGGAPRPLPAALGKSPPRSSLRLEVTLEKGGSMARQARNAWAIRNKYRC